MRPTARQYAVTAAASAAMTLTVPLVPAAAFAVGISTLQLTVAATVGSVVALGLLAASRRSPQVRRWTSGAAAIAAVWLGLAALLGPAALMTAAALTVGTIPPVASTVVAMALSSSHNPSRTRLAYTGGWVAGTLAGGALASIVGAVPALGASAMVQAGLFITLALRSVRRSSNVAEDGPHQTGVRQPFRIRALFVALLLISLGGSFRVAPLASIAMHSAKLSPSGYSILIACAPAVEVLILALASTRRGGNGRILLVVGCLCAPVSFALVVAGSAWMLFVSQALFAVYVVAATAGSLAFLRAEWPGAAAGDLPNWTFSLEASGNLVGAALATGSVALLRQPQVTFLVPTALSAIGALIAVVVLLGGWLPRVRGPLADSPRGRTGRPSLVRLAKVVDAPSRHRG